MWKTLTTLTLATAATLSSIAPASAANLYIVEQGTLSVAKPAEAAVTGAFEEYLDRGPQVTLDLAVERGNIGPACVFARVSFSTTTSIATTVDSGPVCVSDAVQKRPMSATSPANTGSYTIKVLAMTSRSATYATMLAQRTYSIGSDTDSTGNPSGRLDRDLLKASKSAATVFTGWTDYSLNPHYLQIAPATEWAPAASIYTGSTLQSRVQGDLTWSSTMSGTSAYAVMTWTYTDGSKSTFVSEPVSAGLTRHLDASSAGEKEVWSVKVEVFSTSRQINLGVQASTGTVKFGDYLTA